MLLCAPLKLDSRILATLPLINPSPLYYLPVWKETKFLMPILFTWSWGHMTLSAQSFSLLLTSWGPSLGVHFTACMIWTPNSGKADTSAARSSLIGSRGRRIYGALRGPGPKKKTSKEICLVSRTGIYLGSKRKLWLGSIILRDGLGRQVWNQRNEVTDAQCTKYISFLTGVWP